jgi:hypothetical protein
VSRVSRTLILNGLLLAGVVLAILAVEVVDRPASAVEASVRRYAAAVTAGNFDAAIAEVAPDQRPVWNDWVRGQLGNVYDVTGIAVRAGWLLGRPIDVTTDLDINRAYEDEFYQATPRVPLQEINGRWYLRAPLLAPATEL